MADTIELSHYPVWRCQDGEPAEIFNLFERYFLPQIRGNLTAAYRAFIADTGGDSQSISDVSSQWREYSRLYLWRDRHASYWRAKNQDNLQWREEKIRQYQAENLDTARLLRGKAIEILEAFNPLESSPKDAASLLRLAGELTQTALDITDLDRAIAACQRAGFEVSLPRELANDLLNLRGKSNAK